MRRNNLCHNFKVSGAKTLLLLIVASLNLIVYSQCPEGFITSNENLVINGDFEKPNMEFSTQYRCSKIAGAGKLNIVKDAYTFCDCFAGKGDNYFMAVDGANGPNITVWQQVVKVEKNSRYFFSCWCSNIYPIKYGPPAILQFSINHELIGEPFNCPREMHKWEQFFALWDSNDQEKAVITIVSQNPNYRGNDFGLDRIKFYECYSPNFDEQLKQAKAGETLVLRNIFFDTGKTELKKESFDQLNKLYEYMKQNIDVKIEVTGHTDNIGDESSNMKLSKGRANAVAQYIIEAGVEEERFTIIGKGEQEPVDSNDTLEGRQKNRRVEIKIL